MLSQGVGEGLGCVTGSDTGLVVMAGTVVAA
jgi:hypothetical protein